MDKARASVDIYGAGPAGLVAAISLAREGFEVHLFDKQRRIGGNPEWHPSIQTTILKPEQTWEYIGIDLSDCIRRVNSITFYRYGRKEIFTSPGDMYICERGPREGSLDYTLYEKAISIGVQFCPAVEFDVNRVQAGRNIIVATGLDTEVYRKLDISYVPIYGYRGLVKTERDGVLISYMSKCTNYDFAYLGADRGLLFALLFSRKRLAENSLPEFQQILKVTEGIQIDRWVHSTGAIPTTARLFHRNLVLAGTISGMIDPFLLHGISGALISGKIAAQVFTDRDRAICEFRRLTRNFALKKRLKALSVGLPLKQVTLPLMMWVDSRLHGVGFI